MKVIKSSFSIWQRLAVPLLGLFLILPMLHFGTAIKNLIELEERQLLALAREKLLLEAESFQSDLNPEIFVENCLRQMNRDFKLAPENHKDRPLQYPPGYDPELIDDQFIGKMRNYLVKNFDFSPALVIAAGTDLVKTFSWFLPEVIKNEETRRKFTEAAILSTTFDEPEMKNLLPDTPNLEELRQESTKKITRDNFHLAFTDIFRNEISFFASPEHYSDSCGKFFSNIFGNQRAFNYCFRIVKHFPDSSEGLYGLYYLVIFGSEISPIRILNEAIKRNSPNVSRKIFRGSISRTGFQKNKEGMIYVTSFPSSWFLAINDFALKKPEFEKKLKDYFTSNSICTYISNDFLISSERKWLTWLNFLKKIMVILIFAFSVLTWLFPDFLKISLNWKLRLTVALIILIPISAIFLTIQLIDSTSEREQQIRVETIMQKRIRHFEQIENEQLNQIVFNFLKRKILDIELLSSETPDTEKISLAYAARQTVVLTLRALFLNREGFSFGLERDLRVDPREMKTETIGMLKIIAGLGLANENSEKIKNLMKKQYLFGSYADSFWNVFATSKALASENNIIHDFFSVSSLRKSIFQLLALPESPNSPFAVFYHELNDVQTTRQLVRMFLHNRQFNSTITLENGSIDFAMYSRATFSLRKEQWPAPTGVSDQLKLIADQASNKRTSGSSIERQNNSMTLTMWNYREDSPVIYVARANIILQHSSSFSLRFLGWLIFGYGLLTTIFIANGLASLFLNPVKLLLQGVSLVTRNRHDFRIMISGRDEFSELAESFNRMNAGLLQRQKMRRFVSDKLVESLNQRDNEIHSGNRLLKASILSSDIRGFTTLSEKNSPEEIVDLLNEYLTVMERLIKKFGGSVDKIIGDAILATFSAESPEKNAINSCHAAMAMRNALKDFNAKRQQEGKITVENGVGVASGEIILGFAGEKGRRRDMVMLGEPFQTAQYLESISRHGNRTKVIIDRQTYEMVLSKFSFVQSDSDQTEIEAWEINEEFS
ncbi:MAG: adenylate/guanylate cyclase domain-containing protein [Candidatus Rifleibacteriota bacterium]